MKWNIWKIIYLLYKIGGIILERREIGKGNPIALLPLLIFLVVYVFIGVISRDFYAVPMSVPFLIAAMSALVMNRKETFSKK